MILPHHFEKLTELRVESPAVPLDAIVTLAAACPNLKTLLSAGPPYEWELTLGLPLSPLPHLVRDAKEAVPHLSKVQGTVKACQVFVPGRPVESVVILGSYMPRPMVWSRQDLLHVASGTVMLRELTLARFGWRDDGIDIIADMFPALKVLKVQFIGGPEVCRLLLPTTEVPSMTQARILSLCIVCLTWFVASRIYASSTMYAAPSRLLVGQSTKKRSVKSGRPWILH